MQGDARTESGPKRHCSKHMGLLLLVDYLFPISVGVALVAVLWQLDISRCRGWEVWDPSSHLKDVLSFHASPSIQWLYSTVYPPLVYFLTDLLFSLLGPSRQNAELLISLCLIPLSLGAYSLGRIYGGRAAGVLCLVLPLLNEDFIFLSQSYLLDVPLIMMVTLTLLALHKVGQFQKLGASVVLGLVIGAGMMVKYNFFFFCGPVLICGALLLIEGSKGLLLPLSTLLLLGSLILFYFSPGLGDFLFTAPSWPRFVLLYASPFLVIGLFMFLLKRSRISSALLKGDSSYESVRNLMISLAFGISMGLPWYAAQRQHMFDALEKNRGLGLARIDHALQCFYSLNSPWTMALPMLLFGVLVIHWGGPRRQELRWIALGGLLAFLFMVTATDCNTRVFLGILPFVMVLGTWWLKLLGRFSWLVAAAVLTLQIVLIHQEEKPGPRYLYIRPGVQGGALNNLYRSELAEDRARCLMDRRISIVADELGVLTGSDPTSLSFLYRDSKHMWSSELMHQIPGASSNILNIKLDFFDVFPSTYLLKSDGVSFVLQRPAPRDRGRHIIAYFGLATEQVFQIQQRYQALTGAWIDYLGFRHLRDSKGVHFFRVAAANPVERKNRKPE